MKRFPLPLAIGAAALALASCFDFVEPVSLGLTRPTRLEVYLNVTANSAARCPGAVTAEPPPTQPAGGFAVVCLEANLVAGVDTLGRRREVLNDTLYAFGSPIPPTEALGDSVRRYRAAWRVPSAQLADTVFRVLYPVVRGVNFPGGGVRWYAVGRAGPDTVFLPPSGDLSLAVTRPSGLPQPLPRLQQWGLEVYGGAGVVALRGFGVPRARFNLPGELLNDLPGSPFAASLRYTQIYFTDSDPAANFALYVQMTETVDWAIRSPRP